MNTEIPIGGIISWVKSLSGTPQVLPYGWAECNGQTLSDSKSVFNGQVLPNLNTVQSFLRGASSSGGVGGADFHQHGNTSIAIGITVVGGADAYASTAENPVSDAASSLPTYYEVIFIIKIK